MVQSLDRGDFFETQRNLAPRLVAVLATLMHKTTVVIIRSYLAVISGKKSVNVSQLLTIASPM